MDANPFQLEGRIALVTGASQGIGLAIAQIFAQFGAKVVICSRKPDQIEAAAKVIRSATGGEVLPLTAHVGSADDRDQLVAQIRSRFDQLDILVNNAATNPVYGPLESLDGSAFDKIMEVNVKACLEMAKCVLPWMQQQGKGSIINISSVEGHQPTPGLGMYSVSKAALLMLTRVMAKEWGQYGIRANTLSPGLIKTKFSKALWENEKTLQGFTRRLAVNRIGEPMDIAQAALYLASDASAYMTGNELIVDGGYL